MKFVRIIKSNTNKSLGLRRQLYKEIREGYAYYLLKDREITKKDGKLFIAAIDAIKDEDGYELLLDKIITRKEGKVFYDLINYIKPDGDMYGSLLINGIITKKDGELFNTAISSAINEGWTIDLLDEKVITKKELDNFK